MPSVTDPWMMRSQILQVLPTPPPYGPHMMPTESPSPKRMRMQMEHRCTTVCQCGSKQQSPNEQVRGPQFNRDKGHGRNNRTGACSSRDCACGIRCQQPISAFNEHFSRNEKPPHMDNQMKLGHFDYSRGRKIVNNDCFVPSRSSCPCCVQTEHKKPVEWNQQLVYRNRQLPVFPSEIY
eukprot:Seg4214.2 transcript_id=Seg4214.2/GoldUCD/mRNA.D3Y31 product="hypothetical protein" protein_id=Seg4214.2/GoldUCD/D3Y31